MAWQQYRFEAEVIRVLDGDTIEVRIDMGFNASFRTLVRMARINTPELHGATAAAGQRAKQRVQELLPVGTGEKVFLQTYKDGSDKYGRYLADVHVDGVVSEHAGNTICLNDLLVSEGLATYKYL